MTPNVKVLALLCLEVVGLAILSGLAILVGAYHYFDGFNRISTGEAFVFCIVALGLAMIGLIAYASVRIGRLLVQNKLLFRAATRDGLTRLLNRTAFKEEAERAIASIGQRKGDPTQFTLLIADADHFKRINDRLGHGVGDRALVAIATSLAGGVRSYDFVGRLGGEEFAVLLRDAGPAEAAVVAERLRAMVHRLAVGTGTEQARLSISLGAFSFDRPIPFDHAYKQADQCLYKAKRNGRNRAEFASLSGEIVAPAPSRRVSNWTAGPEERRARPV